MASAFVGSTPSTASYWISIEARLGVELDGQHHHDEAVVERDSERASMLLAHGIHVIRFDNDAIFDDTDGVLETILAHLRRPASTR